ncbi:MAG: ABC transporter permease [Chitinophagaceae bacterium]
MIKHYFKIALRSLGRQKALSFINIAGLSIGLACFILFLLFAVNEFNFDRFHKNAANIYRMYRWNEAMQGRDAGGDVYLPSPLGPAMKEDFPDVVRYARFRDGWGHNFVKVDGKVMSIRLSSADPAFFSIFDFPFLYGNPKNAFSNLQDIVITKSKARELFGTENVLGRVMEIKMVDDFVPFTISAVTNDIPANSSLTFDVLGNFAYWETTRFGKNGVNNWHRSSYLTYVELRPGSGLPTDKKRLAQFRHKYYPDEEAELKKAGYSWTGNKFPVRYELQSLKAIHTDTKIWGGSVENVNPATIWILIGIAAGVLLIACINFTTLAIGRSARRAKEVGLRKVIGGEKKQLVFQFLSESIILAIISAILGLLFAKLLLPWFNALSGRELQFSFSQYPELGWMIIALTLLVGILAGSYPALILSGFKPVEVLKSKVKVGGSNFFTKALVTLQFALSTALIIATLIILEQKNYMSTKNPGFSKENVVMIDADQSDTKKIYPLLKQELSERPDIMGVACSEVGLGDGAGWSRTGFEYNGSHKEVYEYFVDHDYIPVMGMKIIAGRNFDPKNSLDTTTSVIINEEMVKDFGWTNETAVGQQLKGYMEIKTPVVIGVVKNFNFRPLTEKIEPQLFHQFADYTPFKFFVRIKPGNPAPAIAAMQKAWNHAEPVIPFKYVFLDESLDNFYKSEQRWSNIVGWAGGISIFLACLGLFGLTALAVVNRTKEIGIRKVLGASIISIVSLLSKDFVRLIVIALVVATPVAWYFMNKWLNGFAYRINIGWLVFAATGLFAIMIALITIGVQALKAGMANPVKSLRTE